MAQHQRFTRNAHVRQEILGNGGPDIGVAGNGQQDYINIHDQHRQGNLPAADAPKIRASYVAGLFRAMRFGSW